jgi:hypothetical protein
VGCAETLPAGCNASAGEVVIKPDQHAGPSQPPPLSYNRFEISVLGPGSRECRRDGTFRTILHRFAWGCTQGCESSGQFSIPDPNPGCDRCVMVTRTRARLLLVVFFVGAPEIFDPPRRSHAAHGAWGGRAPEIFFQEATGGVLLGIGGEFSAISHPSAPVQIAKCWVFHQPTRGAAK